MGATDCRRAMSQKVFFWHEVPTAAYFESACTCFHKTSNRTLGNSLFIKYELCSTICSSHSSFSLSRKCSMFSASCWIIILWKVDLARCCFVPQSSNAKSAAFGVSISDVYLSVSSNLYFLYKYRILNNQGLNLLLLRITGSIDSQLHVKNGGINSFTDWMSLTQNAISCLGREMCTTAGLCWNDAKETSMINYDDDDSSVCTLSWQPVKSDVFFSDAKSERWSAVIGNRISSRQVLSQGYNTLSVPHLNLTGHSLESFTVEVLTDEKFFPRLDACSVLSTPVVYLGPHGAKFYDTLPGIVKLPMGIAVEEGDEVYCLTSDTDLFDTTDWKRMDSMSLKVIDSFVEFEVCHFSLFCVAVSKRKHKVQQNVYACSGASICHPDHPGLVVEFPAYCCMHDFAATVEVLGCDPFYVAGDPQDILAGPVIALGPSGSQFQNHVKISVPLPKANEVVRLCGHLPQIRIFFSQTEVCEAPNWQECDADYEIFLDNEQSVVTFSTCHFTLFKILWNVVDVTLPETVKLPWTPYVPHFSFWVYFQALMTEVAPHEKNSQFGLCIVCSRFGNSSSSGLSQYPLEVGECKPRKMKSGRLKLELKSTMFAANENDRNTKVCLFRGHDFDAHFACQFTCGIQPSNGLFGQVHVSRVDDESPEEEPFSFNLIKSTTGRNGLRYCKEMSRQPSEWEDQLSKELLGMLSIEDHHWQELALCLGYNRSEIASKFASVEDPVHEMLADFMNRSGTVQEFTSAMCKVARMFKLIPLDEMQENRQNRRLEVLQEGAPCVRATSRPWRLSAGDESVGSPVQNDDEKSVGGSSGSKRKSDVFFSRETLSESKFDDVAGEISRSWKSIGRKLSVSEPELDMIERNFQHSGEKEKAFQMLLAWRERDPDNCVLGRLYEVLHDSGLKFTARKCLEQ